MPRDFIPRRDAEFLGFCANFSAKISLSPNIYGLSIEQVGQYALAQEVFAADYRTATTPGTSTVVAVEAKNHAREVLEAQTRMLARIIRAHRKGMDVTDVDLCDLRMCVPKGKRRRVPGPGAAPRLSVRSGENRTVIVHLSDAESSTKGKPRDVYGAILFAYVGDLPPAGMDQESGWQYVKTTTKAKTTITFSAAIPPGTKIWLAANWSNTHGERGPLCQPVYTHLSHGGPMMGANAVPDVSHHPLRFVDQSSAELMHAA